MALIIFLSNVKNVLLSVGNLLSASIICKYKQLGCHILHTHTHTWTQSEISFTESVRVTDQS